MRAVDRVRIARAAVRPRTAVEIVRRVREAFHEDQLRGPLGRWIDDPGSGLANGADKLADMADPGGYLSPSERAMREGAKALIAHGGTAWHVVPSHYRSGDDLVARDSQSGDGIDVSDWKWTDAEEGFDGHAVALFPNNSDGRQQADWLWSDYPDHILLRVEVPPPSERDEDMEILSEGYPAVVGRVPAEWIHEVSRGYDGGVIGENVDPAS